MATSANIFPPNPAAAGEDWTPPYRHRLGVGDSIVQLCPSGFWKPPNPGEFKINFSISLPETDPQTGNYVSDIGGFRAVARNSSGDPFGTVRGRVKFDSEMGLGLYALRAAANLGVALKEYEIHDGSVVYESILVMVTTSLNKNCLRDPEANLKAFMPDDLESVDARCVIRVGTPDIVLHWNPDMRASIEEDKRNAGLSNKSVAAAARWRRTMRYRRRLGIGDSPVVLCMDGKWSPPKRGEFKINYWITMPDQDKETGDYLINVGRFRAVARNSSGDIFGVGLGSMNFAYKLEMELFTLRAAANLAKALKEKGIHDGPVVYESVRTSNLDKRCLGEPEGVTKAAMPRDLEGVDGKCQIHVGNQDELFKNMPGLKALLEKDKKAAGIL